LGKISYVLEHFGHDTLPILFEKILAPDTLVSTRYQYLGSPLTLDYFKDINNWYSNEINLILFSNLAKLGIDAFDTGYYVVKEAQKTQNVATIAYLQMLGPFELIKKVNQVNKIYNRTKQVKVGKFQGNTGQITITYHDNCEHNAEVTRQNVGVYTALLESSGLEQVAVTVALDDFSKNNHTVINFQWLPVSRSQKLRWFTGKLISRLFSQTYLRSDDVIKQYHSHLLMSMEKEITEKEKQRKKSDAYYQQLLAQQAQKERELTDLVKVKTAELEQSIQAKDQLFENVSHELKTPLTLILGRSEQLLKTAELTDSVASEVKHITTSAQQLHNLVEQLLQLAESKNTAKVKEPVDIIQETRFMFDNLSSLAASAGTNISLTLRHTEPSLWLSLQVGCWASVVTNLVTNAIKFGDKDQPIASKLIVEHNQLVFEVTSQGVPIAPDKKEAIFERFEQLSNIKQGQGLGLAIVKQLVVNHGGTIKLSSTAHSNTFTVALPLAFNQTKVVAENKADRPILPVVPVKSPVSSAAPKNHKLLVVEDNQELREFISSALSIKFNVTAVEHGQAAIDWLASNTLPDLILSDVMMPIMDGYQLCETLKQDPVYQYIPLFLLTAKSDNQSIKKGLSLAADDYISKPFNIDVLITKVGNQLATREALKKQLQSTLVATPIKKIDTRSLSEPELLLVRVKYALAELYQQSDIKAKDIASFIYTTEKTLNRKLQVMVGNTITELLREYRLQQAKIMLEQGGKSKEICFDCGFNSMSYFSRCFKEKFGYSPSQVAAID